jgi:prolyl 4-hydroxylase
MEQQILNVNPLVAVFDGFVTGEEAAAAIAAGRDRLGPSGYLIGDERRTGATRSNLNAIIDVWSDPVLSGLGLRLSALVRLPPENMDRAKLLHYQGDEKFDPHQDAYDPASAIGQEKLRSGGQRLFTTICYLNDADGGHTQFPELKISVQPRMGRVLLFSNTVPGTIAQHPHALHAGRPTRSGEKWVLSLWWRQFPFVEVRTYPATDGPMREF